MTRREVSRGSTVTGAPTISPGSTGQEGYVGNMWPNSQHFVSS